MSDDEKNLEAGEQSSGSTSDVMTKEALEDRGSLVAQDQRQRDHLRAGGSSGITDDFGLPTISDDGEPTSGAEPGVQRSYDYVADPTPTVVDTTSDDDVERSHIVLTEMVAEKFAKNPDDLQRFKDDMAEFERRARESNMPLSEITKTYSAIWELLDNQYSYPTTPDEKAIVAQQIMHLAAHPTEVRQGDHGTCNVATIESRLYTTNPSAAAKMVKDVTLTMCYRTNPPPPAESIVVKVNEQAVHQTGESLNHPPSGGERCYASQIFQTAAANIAWERWNQENAPERIRYEQREASPPGTTPSDGGDRLIDYSDPDHPEGTELKYESGAVKHGPNVGNDEIVGIASEITGKSQEGMFISRHSFEGGLQVGSEAELNRELARAKREGRLPITVDVHTGKEPFATDANAAGGAGGWHVVNVTDYAEGNPPYVKVDNEWADRKDHLAGYPKTKDSISVDYLYQAISSDYEDLGERKAELDSKMRDSTPLELVMMRMEERDGDITHEEYLQRLALASVKAEMLWKLKEFWGNPSSDEYSDRADATIAIDAAMRRLSPEDRQRVSSAVKQVLSK